MNDKALATKEGGTTGAIAEQVLIGGDLSKLTSGERANYYMQVCQSVGLNPYTKPFDYITLNGKLTLYAKRDATDQLRKLNKVSCYITARGLQALTTELGSEQTARDRCAEMGVYVVTAKARDGEGREDESTGAVSVGGLKGDALANALMKAETKAKRRVTLSICGMGWMDETEVETVPQARHVNVDATTGEILDTSEAEFQESLDDGEEVEQVDYATEPQCKKLHVLYDKKFTARQTANLFAQDQLGFAVTSTKNLTKQQASALIEAMDKLPDVAKA